MPRIEIQGLPFRPILARSILRHPDGDYWGIAVEIANSRGLVSQTSENPSGVVVLAIMDPEERTKEEFERIVREEIRLGMHNAIMRDLGLPMPKPAPRESDQLLEDD